MPGPFQKLPNPHPSGSCLHFGVCFTKENVTILHRGHVKNNEAKVWQNGHETWKMNPHFDAPASFFLMGPTMAHTKWYISKCYTQKKYSIQRNTPDPNKWAWFVDFWGASLFLTWPIGILYIFQPTEIWYVSEKGKDGAWCGWSATAPCKSFSTTLKNFYRKTSSTAVHLRSDVSLKVDSTFMVNFVIAY